MREAGRGYEGRKMHFTSLNAAAGARKAELVVPLPAPRLLPATSLMGSGAAIGAETLPQQSLSPLPFERIQHF